MAAAYRAGGFEQSEVGAYFPDMAAYFGRADLVVCRAGATTLAELIAARRAAILVPFAGAAEDHQTLNARELAAVGGAVVIPEAEATAASLAARILRSSTTPGSSTPWNGTSPGCRSPTRRDGSPPSASP